MKTQAKDKLSLKKLTIAKISRSMMNSVKGGDCIPTDADWHEHESELYCDNSEIP